MRNREVLGLLRAADNGRLLRGAHMYKKAATGCCCCCEKSESLQPSRGCSLILSRTLSLTGSAGAGRHLPSTGLFILRRRVSVPVRRRADAGCERAGVGCLVSGGGRPFPARTDASNAATAFCAEGSAPEAAPNAVRSSVGCAGGLFLLLRVLVLLQLCWWWRPARGRCPARCERLCIP